MYDIQMPNAVDTHGLRDNHVAKLGYEVHHSKLDGCKHYLLEYRWSGLLRNQANLALSSLSTLAANVHKACWYGA